MRSFSKISPALWRSSRFTELYDEAKLLWFYLATCRHQTSAGIMTLPNGYVTVDLSWPVDKLSKAREQLVAVGMIVHDAETDELFVRNWFKHHPPTNARHRSGLRRLVSDIESEKVRAVAQEELDAVPQPGEQDAATVDEIGNVRRLMNTRYLGGERSAR